MANRSFLLSHQSETPLVAKEHPNAILAAASYSVPLLWLAAFGSESVSDVLVDYEGAAGAIVAERTSTLQCGLADGLRRFDSRAPHLLATLPTQLHPYVAEQRSLLAGAKGQFLQIDLVEIWIMFAPGVFVAELRAGLEALDGTTLANLAPAYEQAGFGVAGGRLSFDPAVVRYLLRGYEWTAPVGPAVHIRAKDRGKGRRSTVPA